MNKSDDHRVSVTVRSRGELIDDGGVDICSVRGPSAYSQVVLIGGSPKNDGEVLTVDDLLKFSNDDPPTISKKCIRLTLMHNIRIHSGFYKDNDLWVMCENATNLVFTPSDQVVGISSHFLFTRGQKNRPCFLINPFIIPCANSLELRCNSVVLHKPN